MTKGCFLLTACLVAAACGKKGPPLPPLLRIPAAPPELNVTRIDEEVYARLVVPSTNVDGARPADIARVELYALTATRAPQGIDPEELRELATLIASEEVRQPLAPGTEPSTEKPSGPPSPTPEKPDLKAVEPGAAVVMREALTPEARVPVELPASDQERPTREEPEEPWGPLIAPTTSESLQRFYFAVAINRSGRYGPPSGFAPAPLGPTSAAPDRPTIEVQETAFTIQWSPPPDARGAPEAAPTGVLPSKPLTPGPPPTTYDVYEVSRNASPTGSTLVVPTPLTAAPVGAHEYKQESITLGTERCFVVRAVDIVSGVHVRGPASPPACDPFADVYPPEPAGKLDAIAAAGTISLIWEPSQSADLAGYLVLRGEGDSPTLTPLTKEPSNTTTYRDAAVQAGSRYVYAVVAVDKAGNRSKESNRVEETARE